MKKFISLALALLMLVVMLPVSALAAEGYVTVSGIKGFEGQQFASFAEAYAAIKPTMETLGLGEETPVNAEAFDALFTDVTDGKATLTYTISGNVTYDEASCKNLLTMGRKTSHYLTNERHLINFKFVGATGRDTDTLTVNSNITLPYEWWGEDITTSISFENLTITGAAPNGLYPAQAYFDGIDFKVDNCKLDGIRIYHYNNVGGSITLTNNIFDGTGTVDAYAVHLQGSETESLNINISNNTISNYARGINIDQKTAVAAISSNTITDLTGVTKNGNTYGSAIQLTKGTTLTVTGNTISTENVNAFHFYKGLDADVTISSNTVKSPYLLWNEAGLDQSKITSADNTLTIANPDKALTKSGAAEETTKIEGTVVGDVTVRVPTTEETTGGQANPSTGANDVVGIAAAAAVVAVLGSVTILRKQ